MVAIKNEQGKDGKTAVVNLNYTPDQTEEKGKEKKAKDDDQTEKPCICLYCCLAIFVFFILLGIGSAIGSVYMLYNAVPECRGDWVPFDDTCARVFFPGTYADAQGLCESENGKLFNPDQYDLPLLTEAVHLNQKTYWGEKDGKPVCYDSASVQTQCPTTKNNILCIRKTKEQKKQKWCKCSCTETSSPRSKN